jgi:hypothetical protein
MSEEDKMHRDYQQNKIRWVANKNFNHHVGKAVANNRYKFTPLCVFNTPYSPPANFQHRSIEKFKWVDKENFFKDFK